MLNDREIHESQKRLSVIRRLINSLDFIGLSIPVSIDYNNGSLIIGQHEINFNSYNELKINEQKILHKLRVINRI